MKFALMIAGGIVISLAACGGGEDLPAPASGIEGIVLVGPTCPVERLESPCPDRPLPDATVRVTPLGGVEPMTVRSDNDGRFHVALQPGAYEITPLPLNSMALPAPGQAQTVVVVAGQFVAMTITYDTGIR